MNGTLITGNPASDTSASSPLDVVVGQSTDPNAQGSLLAVDAPVNASASTAGDSATPGTSLPLINLGQATSGATGTSSDNGPLVALNAPVTTGGETAGSPVSVPLVNVGQGSNALIGPTPGPGTLVNVSSPVSVSNGAPVATPSAATVPLINLS